jgi:hypothetical protein
MRLPWIAVSLTGRRIAAAGVSRQELVHFSLVWL